MNKIKLHGFNNLSKTLTFTSYMVFYATSSNLQNELIEKISNKWDSSRFCNILTEVTKKLDAKILNLTNYDYDPHGSSVNILMEDANYCHSTTSFAHLDKSHIAMHTYPEINPTNGLVTFRIDLDVSTCGAISPLSVIDFLFENLGFDIIVIDYKIRGFTRTSNGSKLFNDRQISSITEFISNDRISKYDVYDQNIIKNHTFQTRMVSNSIRSRQQIYTENYNNLPYSDICILHKTIKQEMYGIYKQTEDTFNFQYNDESNSSHKSILKPSLV